MKTLFIKIYCKLKCTLHCAS